MLIPPPLQRDSIVRLVAPSGPFDRVLFWRAVGWLAKFCKVHFEPTIFERHGFLAGSDDRRRAEFQSAIDDRLASAVVFVRGGWGSAKFSHSLDYTKLRTFPKWLVGFSDPTTMHMNSWRLGIATMHASNLVALGRSDAVARETWLDALRCPMKSRVLRGTAAGPGLACGPLVGGNLTILTSGLSTGSLSLPDGCILALEDVAETSYRVDRMLSALINSGAVDRISAVAAGEFVDCDSGIHQVDVANVLRSHLLPMGIPVVTDLPFGHGRNNQPLPFGTTATLDGFRGELRLGSQG